MFFEKQIVGSYDFSDNYVIRFAEAFDEKQIRNLANRSFKYSRFHLDPSIPDEVANRIKNEWAGNFFAGNRGQQMVIAANDNRILGFAQLLFVKDKSITIDLIAVDKNIRQKGVASNMISYIEENYHSFEKIIAGTQVANIASLRLYEKCGFKITGANYIFHYHISG
jgi:ribosomal protein S18 acetylase RimI-like enzyme